HVRKIELALAAPLDEQGQFLGEMIGNSDDFRLFVDQFIVRRNFKTAATDTSQRRATFDCKATDCLLHSLWQPNQLQTDIHAVAAGQADDFANRVTLRRVDWYCSQVSRQIKLRLLDVHGINLACPKGVRQLNGRQAKTANPNQ